MRLLFFGALALLACSKRSAEPESATGAPPVSAADAGAVDAAAPVRERVVLAEVRAGVVEGPGAAVEAPTLAEQLTATLVMSGWFAHDARSVPTGHRPRPARVEVLVSGGMIKDRKSGHWLMMVTAQAQVSWLDRGTDPAPVVKVAIERDLGPGKPGGDGQPVMEAAAATVATMARALSAEERVRSGPPEELRKALAGDDDDLRLWALELARERKPRDLVDDIGKLLGSKDPDVRERALGALLSIGDPRAAGAIADHARTDDLQFLRNAIDAVAALGGQDAIDWLEFLAGGHSDPDIRAQAGRALERARARTPQP